MEVVQQDGGAEHARHPDEMPRERARGCIVERGEAAGARERRQHADGDAAAGRRDRDRDQQAAAEFAIAVRQQLIAVERPQQGGARERQRHGGPGEGAEARGRLGEPGLERCRCRYPPAPPPQRHKCRRQEAHQRRQRGRNAARAGGAHRMLPPRGELRRQRANFVRDGAGGLEPQRRVEHPGRALEQFLREAGGDVAMHRVGREAVRRRGEQQCGERECHPDRSHAESNPQRCLPVPGGLSRGRVTVSRIVGNSEKMNEYEQGVHGVHGVHRHTMSALTVSGRYRASAIPI